MHDSAPLIRALPASLRRVQGRSVTRFRPLVAGRWAAQVTVPTFRFIDKPLQPATATASPPSRCPAPKENPMNVRTTTRAASMAFAFIFTFAMLAGVNGLATSDTHPDALLATSASQPTQG